MSTPVKVVLQTQVEHLGNSGDVVKVKAGFARNYLIPRGLAAPATALNLARIDELKKLAEVKAAKEIEEAKELAVKLESLSVKLERKVGAENKMYGSVTSKDIEEAYAEQGLVVDRRKVELPDPIKSLGLHEVQIRLLGDVTAKLRVEVVKKS
jgi:large subunit ribosomal protein L9